jgi:NAD(P) transhydrogenase subunit alpha
VAASRDEALGQADAVVMVRGLGANPQAGRDDLPRLRGGQSVICLCDPLGNPAAARELAERGVSVFALELIPRITRAQSMDVLSSMATVAGYKAVLLAADRLPRFFPMFMTAAGTVTAAKVLVIGAGVAGLQAIATARRLGAVVLGYDVRPAAMEQIESLGAKAVRLELETRDAEDRGGYAKELSEAQQQRQRELLADVVAQQDVCITTAAVPGKASPVLVTADTIRRMPRGAVIVDLAAERGGNCEGTRPDETVLVDGVTILGPTNLPSELPGHASQMFARNVASLLMHLVKDGSLRFDIEDEITRETLVARDGQVTNQRIRDMLGIGPVPVSAEGGAVSPAGDEYELEEH